MHVRSCHDSPTQHARGRARPVLLDEALAALALNPEKLSSIARSVWVGTPPNSLNVRARPARSSVLIWMRATFRKWNNEWSRSAIPFHCTTALRIGEGHRRRKPPKAATACWPTWACRACRWMMPAGDFRTGPRGAARHAWTRRRLTAAELLATLSQDELAKPN